MKTKTKLTPWPAWIVHTVRKNHPHLGQRKPPHRVNAIKPDAPPAPAQPNAAELSQHFLNGDAARRLDEARVEAALPTISNRSVPVWLRDTLRQLIGAAKRKSMSTVKIRITRACLIEGQHAQIGSIWDVSDQTFRNLVSAKRCELLPGEKFPTPPPRPPAKPVSEPQTKK